MPSESPRRDKTAASTPHYTTASPLCLLFSDNLYTCRRSVQSDGEPETTAGRGSFGADPASVGRVNRFGRRRSFRRCFDFCKRCRRFGCAAGGLSRRGASAFAQKTFSANKAKKSGTLLTKPKGYAKIKKTPRPCILPRVISEGVASASCAASQQSRSLPGLACFNLRDSCIAIPAVHRFLPRKTGNHRYSRRGCTLFF